jgi:hypothetical protein
MTNFVLLYTGGFMPANEADRTAMMEAWGAWYAKLGPAIVDGGNPFGAARSITAEGVSDGSVSSPPVTGYTTISAESLDTAVELVRKHPHVKYGGQVTVFETFKM